MRAVDTTGVGRGRSVPITIRRKQDIPSGKLPTRQQQSCSHILDVKNDTVYTVDLNTSTHNDVCLQHVACSNQRHRHAQRRVSHRAVLAFILVLVGRKMLTSELVMRRNRSRRSQHEQQMR